MFYNHLFYIILHRNDAEMHRLFLCNMQKIICIKSSNLTEARTYDESSGKMDCRYCNTFLRPVFRCDTDCAAGTAAAGRSVRGKAGSRLCERFGTDWSPYLARQQYAFDQGCNDQGQEAAECCNRAGDSRVGQPVQSVFRAGKSCFLNRTGKTDSLYHPEQR